MKFAALVLIGAFATSEAFSPSAGFFAGNGLQLRSAAQSSMQKPLTRRGITLVRMGWQELMDEASGCPYYYNDETQVTQWEKPAGFGVPVPPPPPAPPKKAAAPAAAEAKPAWAEKEDRRKKQLEAVLERQRIQDEEKAKKGPLALESNRGLLVLASLFIGLPLGVLLIAFLTGAIPNPFEVCVQGGTNC